MRTPLQKLFEHIAWADDQVLRALRDAPGSESRALSYFAHILGAESVWLARVRGEPPRLAVWPTLSLDECAEMVAEHRVAFVSVVADADARTLQRDVSYVNSAGRAFTSTLEDILIHVALHGTYHRGQVSIFMRDSGGVPAPTDYIAMARGAAAATRSSAPSA